MVRTEIDKIKSAVRNYGNPKNKKQFNEALAYLKKVKSTYGTIDISLIKDILR
tara:strand:+ start:241 stop:399 length:159 start_codon:yes stop_codon:yes gene_type:complete